MTTPASEENHSGPNMETPSQLERLGALLLNLYRIAADSPTQLFQDRALAELHAAVQFDSAMWGTGSASPEGPIVHSVHVDRQPPEMMQNYESVKQHDTLAVETSSNLGVTFNVAASNPRYVLHPDLMAHTRRFGMAHALATNFADGMHLFTAVSLFRSDPDRPYSEAERQFVQALIPHLAETWSCCRLRSVTGGAVSKQSPRSRALCDRLGILHAAAPSFAELLRAEWPEWQGPVLPKPFLGEWLKAERSHYAGRTVVGTSDPVGELRLIKLRGVTALDSLTSREQAVVQRFGNGSSHKAIAIALHISPVTVRNHLQAAYAKLGVSDKASLANLLHDAES